MFIQPDLGMGLSASVRLQLNLDMQRVADLPPFDKLPEERLLVPVMWFENTINKPPESLTILLEDALSMCYRASVGSLIAFSGMLIYKKV